jgi:SpoVK/Ycf46/Vps4 family AAA+-type ATPase
VSGPSSSEVPEFVARRPRHAMADVILPPRTALQLEEALAKIRHHGLIYEQWGFASIDPTGRALTLALFGPPGTGKTRAAEAIAGELGQSFLAVDGGRIESKFFGDSAKNVRAVFKAAADQNAVLFFDEADSIFGKRASTVTQGVDHEVNVLKSTLLTETEQFRGVLILATNFERNLDPAFRRRISWHVQFVTPDAATRRRLWSLHLVPGIPMSVPREELLDFATSESEGFAGGDILTALRIALAQIARESGPAARLGAAALARACEEVRQAALAVGGSAAMTAAILDREEAARPGPPAASTAVPTPPQKE